MPQEFQVLRCYKCQTFQVHQVKKSKKWNCKLCGEKQSIIKVYGRGTGADCRKHVQKLNMMRGEIDEVRSDPLVHASSLETPEEHHDSHQDDGRFDPGPPKWSNFVDEDEESLEGYDLNSTDQNFIGSAQVTTNRTDFLQRQKENRKAWKQGGKYSQNRRNGYRPYHSVSKESKNSTKYTEELDTDIASSDVFEDDSKQTYVGERRDFLSSFVRYPGASSHDNSVMRAGRLETMEKKRSIDTPCQTTRQLPAIKKQPPVPSTSASTSKWATFLDEPEEEDTSEYHTTSITQPPPVKIIDTVPKQAIQQSEGEVPNFSLEGDIDEFLDF